MVAASPSLLCWAAVSRETQRPLLGLGLPVAQVLWSGHTRHSISASSPVLAHGWELTLEGPDQAKGVTSHAGPSSLALQEVAGSRVNGDQDSGPGGGVPMYPTQGVCCCSQKIPGLRVLKIPVKS